MEQANGSLQDCLQNEPAFCVVACPFRLDVRGFIEKVQRGGYNAAYRTYLNAVGFPGIVTALCDEPCKEVCPRGEIDAAIAMRLLENAVVDFAHNTAPNNYSLPPKNKKVAVIGAGISGLACALRLASKKYEVVVYERSAQIGGQLWELLPPEKFLAEIEKQFAYEQYVLCLNQEITSLDSLDCDAVYIATGAGGATFGLGGDPGGAFASSKAGVFLGGSLTGGNTMQAIGDGLHVTGAIERYLKTGGMNQPVETPRTGLVLDRSSIAFSEPILPKGSDAYAQEEAILEAKRCLRCACEACMRHCDLMTYFKKPPKRIAEEVEITIHPGTLDGNGTVATRFISTCNQCGLCREVCPLHIDIGDFLLTNHRIMRQKGAMPWVFHDFFLRDMEFTNSEEAHLSRLPTGYTRSSYAFFPGCQLGASDPQYVIESYRWLRTQRPDTALLLNCCGAPAEWAGDEGIRDGVTGKLRQQWIALGRPVLVFACLTCKQIFRRHLPEIEGTTLYEMLAGSNASPKNQANGEVVSVFDPCSSREEPEAQEAVRELARRSGFALESLPLEKKQAACCSWGGQVKITHPPYARYVTEARVAESDQPYLAYCANCRDIFAASGKPSYHILDVMFGINGPGRLSPTITERRNNRIRLKRQVLSTFWKEESTMEPSKSSFKLQIAPQLRQKLDAELILESEIMAVIEHCESSGKKVVDPETGHFSGHLQIGKVTYWAEYVPTDQGFELINAYSHRMSIEES